MAETGYQPFKKMKIPSDNQLLIYKGKNLNNSLIKNLQIHSTFHLMIKGNAKYNFKELIPYLSSNEICIFMIGSKISFLDRDLNETMSVKRKYKKLHDIFRQQLPLPILLKAIEMNQNIKLFLIDPEFTHKPEIIQNIPQLKKLSKATNVKQSRLKQGK